MILTSISTDLKAISDINSLVRSSYGLARCVQGACGFIQRNRTTRFLSENPQLKTSLSIFYHVLGNRRYHYVREAWSEALSDGVGEYRYGFIWSGRGRITATVRDPNQTIIPAPDRFGHPGYKVLFRRPLQKGQIAQIVIDLDMHDEASTARPFLSMTLTPEMKSACLEVELPKNAATSQYIEEIAASRFCDVFMDQKIKRFPAGRKAAIWDISRKTVGLNYRIWWGN